MEKNDGVIMSCKNVSVVYPVGDFREIGLKEYIIKKLNGNYHTELYYANKGITFTLKSGDLLGIIGTNGAGKSTLLKAVSGIIKPTDGEIITKGKISALLELGTGFDGDLTVRENTYLRGALLGYSKNFIDSAYREIIDFAELRDIEERKFKHLSSGMKSRLAFSIAAHVNPDILILDEVLSVGDGGFKVKSAAKMKSIISSGKITILVSHSISQIRELCNKILWLEGGRQIVFSSEKERILDEYEAFLKASKRNGG